MPGLNRVQIIGNLGADPQQKETKNGTKFTIFSVAVNRYWKDAKGETNKRTDWFNVESWGKTGEICMKILQKGTLVYLEGELRTSRYEKEGETKFFTKVVVNRVQKLDYSGKEKESPDTHEISDGAAEEE